MSIDSLEEGPQEVSNNVEEELKSKNVGLFDDEVAQAFLGK